VAETPLDRAVLNLVLKLTGGTTRSYVRVGSGGKLSKVSQYRTPQRVHKLAWGSLTIGMKVNLGGTTWYQVVATNVALTSNETKFRSTGSKAAAAKMHAQGPSQAQKGALAKGRVAAAKNAKYGITPSAKTAKVVAAKKVHLKMRNMQTGTTTVMSNPGSTVVWVG
jgi:hypothetical protein